MKTKFIRLFTVFTLLWLTGCTINTAGKDKEFDDFPPVMAGYMDVKGKKYEMQQGNYRWERKKGSDTEVVTTDAASPNQIGESFRAIKVQPNATVNIEIEENPKISVYQWNESGREKEVNVKNNQLAVPSSKGRYIYEVLAKWSDGEVSYTFGVEVN
ncbi:hypothetical protein AWM68_02445 [Fictibacillus phosphorivorans]|uniref:Lipoprotein n=1 Tax=Fictibacillus phosphorivorans TaxID=1221500 RepID=A0A163SI26_9BACL|nr:hypothetical protein [Fictibacillus phosphorivorans]KZE69147.1 hypothetical protein AWM68_02445 [Fictibacillus phosphorivorans]